MLRIAALLLMAAAAVLTPACGGSPPDKELRQAKAAIDSARGAGAAQYARAEFAASEDALKRATDAVAEHDYRLALNHALDARERADAAARQAAEGKALARADADRALRDLTAALGDARSRLTAAEAAHAAPRLLAEARRTIADADAAVQKARTQIEAGEDTAATAALVDMATRTRVVTRDLEAATGGPARRHRQLS